MLNLQFPPNKYSSPQNRTSPHFFYFPISSSLLSSSSFIHQLRIFLPWLFFSLLGFLGNVFEIFKECIGNVYIEMTWLVLAGCISLCYEVRCALVCMSSLIFAVGWKEWLGPATGFFAYGNILLSKRADKKPPKNMKWELIQLMRNCCRTSTGVKFGHFHILSRGHTTIYQSSGLQHCLIFVTDDDNAETRGNDTIMRWISCSNAKKNPTMIPEQDLKLLLLWLLRPPKHRNVKNVVNIFEKHNDVTEPFCNDSFDDDLKYYRRCLLTLIKNW